MSDWFELIALVVVQRIAVCACVSPLYCFHKSRAHFGHWCIYVRIISVSPYTGYLCDVLIIENSF